MTVAMGAGTRVASAYDPTKKPSRHDIGTAWNGSAGEGVRGYAFLAARLTGMIGDSSTTAVSGRMASVPKILPASLFTSMS